jgi:hypothetical protein
MKEKYPDSYLKGCDEYLENAREGFIKIKEILTKKRNEMKGDQELAIEELVTEIWKSRGLNLDQIMNEKQCQGFLNEFIKQFDGQIKMTEEAFSQIFKVLDTNFNEQISRSEMVSFINIFTKS